MSEKKHPLSKKAVFIYKLPKIRRKRVPHFENVAHIEGENVCHILKTWHTSSLKKVKAEIAAQ